ncbi:MAG TPA: hypothetical protein VEZ40_18785 [Pyrinomonadaceae bacterium]|nr:hypothetical protein [Pyrinomonadaceae bacterium]
MDAKPCSLEILPGQRDSTRRAVLFLIYQKVQFVDAKDKFQALSDDEERTLLSRIDYWIDGKVYKKYFHGWDASQYRGKYTTCFVFKLQERRFYGFLAHPKSADRRFEACVLVLHQEKNQWETEEGDLRRIKEISEDAAVRKALMEHYDPKSGSKK